LPALFAWEDNMTLFNGKVAIVTGAGRGIGAAVARLLAAQGAKVVVGDLDEAPAREVVSAIEKAGGKGAAVSGNVMEEDTNNRLIKAATDLGGLDIMVPCAGFCADAVIQKMTLDQFRLMMRIHLEAPWMLCKAAYPVFKEKSADGAFRKVIFVSSEAGTRGNAGQTNYSAAKSGVVGMMKTLAKEWLKLRVNCNAVAYGFVDTRLTQAQSGEEVMGSKVGIPAHMRDMGEQFITMRGGRILTPEEGAGAIVMLASPWSDGVNGQIVEVDSGVGL
jgi:3-oxoacyl-[acyl-carrier protein] reductase